MLYRKISKYIEAHLLSADNKILVLEGVRQIGKSYIIREVGTRLFKNFVEVNFVAAGEGSGLFRNLCTSEDLYLALSMVAGGKLGNAGSAAYFHSAGVVLPSYQAHVCSALAPLFLRSYRSGA